MWQLIRRGQYATPITEEFENAAARVKAFFLREHNEDGTHVVPEAGNNFIPVGMEAVWPLDTAPSGWIFARGQAVSRVSYSVYFALVGTKYGAGDGVLTFNVPNVQGRTVYGKAVTGTGSTLAGTFGSMDHTHTGAGGAHTHTFADASSTTSSDGAHTHTFTTGVENNQSNVTHTTEDDLVANNAHIHTGTTDSGGSHTHTVAVSGTTSSDGASATTDASNPPGIAQNWIIFTGVVA